MSFLFQRDGDAFNIATRADGCVAYNPRAKAPGYGYVPSIAPGAIFVVAFSLALIAHTVQTWRSRKWWYSTFALGALGELLGWAGRLASHSCPYNKTYFTLQISVLILSPCFFSAGIYYILSQLIAQYGRRHSPISPRLYLMIFCAFDLLSIVIQAIGGGMASSASSKVPIGNTKAGTNTMIGGIILQLVSMCVFCALLVYFLYRARAETFPRVVAWTMVFSSACIVIRNFYRAVELGQGWEGYLITHEAYFCCLDGGLMVLAVVVFNIWFPARYTNGIPETRAGGMEKQISDQDQEMGMKAI